MTEQDVLKEIEAGEKTFVVRIKYHQNRTWQGELTREGSDEKVHFRSEFELLHLIQSAMEAEQSE